MCDQRKPGIYVNGVHSETITNAAFARAVKELKTKLPIPPDVDSVKAREWLWNAAWGYMSGPTTWKTPNVTLGSEDDR